MSSNYSTLQQIQNIKILAYHHIQQNMQKFNNRLVYVLIEALIQHCHNNFLLESLAESTNSATKEYIVNFIELVMQEQIQGKIGNRLNRDVFVHDKKQQEVKKRDKFQSLQRESQALRKQVESLTQKLAKQTRKVHKVLAKYNSMAELTFQLREKHKRDLEQLEERYINKTRQLQERNSHLKEEVVRLTVNCQLFINNRIEFEHLYPKNIFKTKQTTKRLSFSSLYQHTIINKRSNLTLTRNNISLKIENKMKYLSICSLAFYQQVQQTQRYEKCTNTNNLQTQQDQTQTHIDESSQNFHFSTQTQSFAQNDLQNILKDKAEYEKQIQILQYLNESYHQKLKVIRQQNIMRTTGYIKLAQQYNQLFAKFESFQETASFQLEQSKQQIRSFYKQMQSLINQNQKLRSLAQLYQSNPNYLPIQQKSHSSNSSPSDTSDQITTTPRKKDEIQILETNISQQYPERQFPPKLDLFIRKDMISKYLLEMLNQECRGESKLVMINQIAQCLNWRQEDLNRIEFYKRSIRHRPQIQINQAPIKKHSNFELPFKEKLFYFLTEGS